MTLAEVTRIIQFILAPVVMVSTCAIFLGNLMSRYAIINERLRTLAQEHRSLVLLGAPAGGAPEDVSADQRDLRLQEIDAQIPNLLHRHRLLRRGVVILNCAVLVFFLDMLVIATVALENAVDWITGMALLNFLIGISCTAWGVLLSTLEASSSHLAVEHDLSWLPTLDKGRSRADARGNAQMRALVRRRLQRDKPARRWQRAPSDHGSGAPSGPP